MHRRNEFDVENRINTTDSDAVSHEVRTIYQDLYQKADADSINQAFRDVALLYAGEYPGYYACDTSYHDIQHVLDVTLAMARLMDGAARATHTNVLTERLFSFGIVTALYHDCGYIRHRKDTRHANGAEYTKIHVSRGGRFLEDYLHKIGMGETVGVSEVRAIVGQVLPETPAAHAGLVTGDEILWLGGKPTGLQQDERA